MNQRENRREDIFFTDEDRHVCLNWLAAYSLSGKGYRHLYSLTLFIWYCCLVPVNCKARLRVCSLEH